MQYTRRYCARVFRKEVDETCYSQAPVSYPGNRPGLPAASMLFLSPAGSLEPCTAQCTSRLQAIRRQPRRKTEILHAVMLTCVLTWKGEGGKRSSRSPFTAVRNTQKKRPRRGHKQIVQTQDLKSKLQCRMQCDRTAGERRQRTHTQFVRHGGGLLSWPTGRETQTMQVSPPRLRSVSVL